MRNSEKPKSNIMELVYFTQLAQIRDNRNNETKNNSHHLILPLKIN